MSMARKHKTVAEPAVACTGLLGAWQSLPAAARAVRRKWRRLIIELRFKLAIFRLKLGTPRMRLYQIKLKYNLILLYLLDKDCCLSVLRSLNEQSEQLADLRNSFKCGHKCDDTNAPNDKLSDERPH